MNIIICKVIVQGFVDDNLPLFKFKENDHIHNYSQIWNLAQELDEEEILEILTYLSDKNMVEHMFSLKGLI